MSSAYEALLAVEVLARLKAAPNLVKDATNIRRAHRTVIPKLSPGSFVVHVVDGNDEPTRGGRSKCGLRRGSFTLSLFARDDAGPTVLDALKIEVNRRLDPLVASWPPGVIITQGRIAVDTEIADADAIRLDLEYELTYPTASEWSLEYAAP